MPICRLSLELADCLEETITATHGAMTEAYARRRERSQAVAQEISNATTMLSRIEKLVASFKAYR